MDLGTGLPVHHDGKLIGTNQTPQDGRMKNAKCRPYRSGDSSNAGAGSTKSFFGVQSEASKERCARTRKRTVINPLTNACHQITNQPGLSPPNLRSGSTEGTAPRASAIASTLKAWTPGPMRRRRRRGSPEPRDKRKITASPVNGSGAHGRGRKPGKNLLDRSASFRDGPAAVDLRKLNLN